MEFAYAQVHAGLVEACRRGDRMAQYRLYELYSKAMYNICVRLLKDQAKAEDALQEAFLKAYNKLDHFTGKSSFGAWLKRIVINECLGMLRKKQIQWEEISELSEPDADTEPGEVYNELLDLAVLNKMIQELPDGCRWVFVLYQLEGYDHDEISQILQVSVSTSKSQYHRAKKLLQQKVVLKLQCK